MIVPEVTHGVIASRRNELEAIRSRLTQIRLDWLQSNKPAFYAEELAGEEQRLAEELADARGELAGLLEDQ